jgi:putative membrane protein
VTNKLIYAVATILVLAIFVIYLTPKMEIANGALEYLPALNASINATVSVLLILGYYFIRIKKDRKWHSISMKSAFILTALFLISYVIYHTTHESTSYGGEGVIRAVYLVILLTHIVLAAAIVPLVLVTFSRALTEKFDKHKRIARITFPLWLYVSITGVVVYLMISPYYA